MKYLKRGVWVLGLIIALAACSTNIQQSEQFFEPPPAPSELITPLASTLLDHDTSEGLTVEVIGIGMGNRFQNAPDPRVATLAIPDPGSVVMLRASVITKGGDPSVNVFANTVTISTDDAQADIILAGNTPSDSTAFGRFYEGSFMGGPSQISATIDGVGNTARATPRAFVVFIFRDAAGAPGHSGSFPNEDLWGNRVFDGLDESASRILNIPVEPDVRDVDVTFAISDLEIDDRIVVLRVEAVGVSPVEETIQLPNQGEELVIQTLTLTGVPGSTSAVTATVISPEDRSIFDSGDSIFWTGVNVAPQPPLLGKLGDFVWNDLDMDGIQDPGELGIEGVTVNLLDCALMQLDSTETDNTGMYIFDDLPQGCYVVEFVNPGGNFVFSPQDQGSDFGLDSDADPTTGQTAPINLGPGETNLKIDAGLYEKAGICLVIIDEDSIDNGTSTIEDAANSHNIDSDRLVNDDRSTEVGNPWLRWNTMFPGDVVLIPTGEVDDEGWFALPENPVGKNGAFSVEDFVAGTVPQDKLDEVKDVMPLRNQDLAKLVGRTCVAIVYDSDISMNYEPIEGNLQGERYGKFAFTVLAAEVPGSIDESQSDTSLYDLWLRVEAPIDPTERFDVVVHDHEPDSIQITRATYSKSKDKLTIRGESSYANSGPGPMANEDFKAFMTVSVDGPDGGSDLSVDPLVFEVPMTFLSGGKFKFTLSTPVNLKGRRVTISTDEGGAYNAYIE